VGWLNTGSSARDSRRGQNPGTAAFRSGRFTAQQPAGKTVSGCILRGNALDTRREEKAPKGESHERSRRETKPARQSREKTVKRVAKP
jgi:hypothetical protein